MNLMSRLKELNDLVSQAQFSSEDKDLSADEAFFQIHSQFQKVKERNAQVWVIGNGGSAGIASHHAVDLVNIVKIPALTLTDSNLVTCMANDFGYEEVYARPLELMIKEGDLLIAISSSGKSPNIIAAVKRAQEKSAFVLTVSGFASDNPLRSSGDINVWTGISDYGLVESAHFFILHSLADTWKEFSS